MTPTYWLVLWLVAALPQGATCMPDLVNKVTFGNYANRAECEGAFTAGYGAEGLDPGFKVLHMCVKATSVLP